MSDDFSKMSDDDVMVLRVLIAKYGEEEIVLTVQNIILENARNDDDEGK